MLKKGVERTLSKVGIQLYKDQKNNYFITCRRRTWLKNSYYSLFLFFPEETTAAFHIDTVSCQPNHPSSTQASKSNPLATPKIHQIMKTQMIKNLLPLSNEVEDEQLIPTTLSYVIPANSHCVPAWKIIHNYNLSQSWCPCQKSYLLRHLSTPNTCLGNFTLVDPLKAS